MARIDELEERIEYIESTKKNEVALVKADKEISFGFYASSYYVDCEIDVMSTAKANVKLVAGDSEMAFDTNYIVTTISADKINKMSVIVETSGELLCVKIRLKGIGVKLLSE